MCDIKVIHKGKYSSEKVGCKKCGDKCFDKECDCICERGRRGKPGIQGPQGLPGIDGRNAILNFAEFYSIVPRNNPQIIAVGSPVAFEQNGPTSIGSTITRLSPGTFNIGAIGTYEIIFQVSISEPGQLIVVINSAQIIKNCVGRETGNSQIVGNVLITISTINSIISINNPTGNSSSLTVTPNAGGNFPVSCNLIIKQIA